MQISEIREDDIEYPEKLYNIDDRPKKLYAIGNLENLKRKCVAIIGARNCTIEGRNNARKMAYYLANDNKVIVSGLAKGIDSYAHIGALEARGRTIAVLGSGLNRIYPIENRSLAKRIVLNGGTLISEYAISSPILRENFAKRNRIISGISDSIIIMEARKKSGTLITANYALEQGRDIYCIPGRIDNENYQGTNELIKNGAKILYSFSNCNII